MYDNSEEVETVAYYESGTCGEFDFAEAEYEYGEADVQGYEE
jgi:hypothetical protein